MKWRTKGIIMLVALLISEIISRLIYYSFANRMDDRCYEHIDKAASAGELCSHIASAASHAFTTSTVTHMPIIVAVIGAFFLLASRLDKLESQIDKIEDKDNV